MDPAFAKGNERPDIIPDLDRLKSNCNDNPGIVVELLTHLYQKSGPKWIAAIEEGYTLFITESLYLLATT